MVWDAELTAGEIARRFDVSWPAISQNLGVLRDAGLLIERRDANRRYYRADHAAAGPIGPALEQMWAADLSRLQQALEEDA